MHSRELDILNQLDNQRKRYARATVVRRKVPSSGKPGDSAIILEDGTIHGWIGGGCTRGIVLKEALLAIQDGKPRFISIAPDHSQEESSGTLRYTMTCQSGGAVDLFIEPVLPRPHLILFGQSHIAKALAKIALAMDYRVSAVDASLDPSVFGHIDGLEILPNYEPNPVAENSYLIVCTQGQGDEDALEMALKSGHDFIAFVSSRRKANAIFRTLKNRGIGFEALKNIKTPAGLDIHAKLPEEVAISILAQIIKDIRKPREESEGNKPLSLDPDQYYINPVCQVPIHKATAKHIITHRNESVYFCCDGCKEQFEHAPEKYLTSSKV